MRHALLVGCFVMALALPCSASGTLALPVQRISEAARTNNVSSPQRCVSCLLNTAPRVRKRWPLENAQSGINHARNLTDAEWQDRISEERIFNSIMNGKGKMPSYQKKLSEREIDLLVA